MNKNLIIYIKITIVIAVISIITLFSANGFVNSSEKSKAQYDLVVTNLDSVWVYEIFYQDKLLIKQEYIPAVQGGQRFETKEDAMKIGQLMITKLKNRKTPNITINDLKINNIKFKI